MPSHASAGRLQEDGSLDRAAWISGRTAGREHHGDSTRIKGASAQRDRVVSGGHLQRNGGLNKRNTGMRGA